MATEVCSIPMVAPIHSFGGFSNYGGNYGGNYGSNKCDTSCLETLIQSNTIHEGHNSIQNAVSQGAKENLSASAGVAREVISELNTDFGMLSAAIDRTGTRAVDATMSTLDAVRQEGRATEKAICDTRDAVRQEGRLNEQGFARVNENINDRFQATFAKLCDQDKEVLKGFHQTQLDACKNTAELARQIAECCCKNEQVARELNAQVLAKLSDTEVSRLKDELQLERIRAACASSRPGQGH